MTKKGLKYYAIIYLGIDALGKKKYKWSKGFEKRKDAEKELSIMLAMYHDNNASGVITNDLTFSELAEEYLEIALNSTAKRTYDRYSEIITSVNQIFGSIMIVDIKTVHIQRYLTSLKYKAATKRKIYQVMSNVFNIGINFNLLKSNPCTGIVLPKLDHPEMIVWDKDQITYFLSQIEVDYPKWYIPYLIAFTTGMRAGEICALKWKDFDSISKIIVVQRSMLHDWTLKETKNKSSKRKIVLSSTLASALVRQQTELMDALQVMNIRDLDSKFICVHESGSPINPQNISKNFIKLAKKYALPRIRFHDARHTFATMMLKNGTNAKIVSEILGHSSINTTLGTYSHILPDIQGHAIELFEKNLFDAKEDKIID